MHTVEEAMECTNRIGLPVMFKASWGGGGKGIRKVRITAINALSWVGMSHVR